MILGIYCAGSLGKEFYDIAIRINSIYSYWEKIIFVDDSFQKNKFYGTEVYHINKLSKSKQDIEFVIANGTPINRGAIYHKLLNNGYILTNLVDPTAIISPTSKLGKGIIITPYSTISSEVVLEDNVLVQSYVRVGHNITICKNSVISCNVCIGGGSTVGKETYIGQGAIIKDGLTIGEETIVGMGTVQHSDVADGVIVVGNPGRVVKKNIDGKIFK